MLTIDNTARNYIIKERQKSEEEGAEKPKDVPDINGNEKSQMRSTGANCGVSL